MPKGTRCDTGSVRATIQSTLFLLLLLAVPGLAAGHPPVITGVDPDPLVSRPDLAMYAMTIKGQNFWLGGPNDPDRRQLSVRRQGQPFQTMRIQGISNTNIHIEFETRPLLNGVGMLEFMVKIDGVASNIFAVRIVAEPPRLDSVTPATINVGGATDDPRWKVWLRGSRWITPTSIWINGANFGTCFQNQNSGQEHFTWPPSLRGVGRYSVLLRTVHGVSEARTVDVVVPPAAKNLPGGASADIVAPPLTKNLPGGASATILRPTPTPAAAFRRR